MFTMFSAGPPDTPNRILRFARKLIHTMFGHVQWQAPEWIRWTGAQVSGAVRFLRADRKRLLAAAVAFLLAAGAIAWYKLRPRPHYVEYTVTAPKLTEYDENGISTIYPLAVDFAEPAAPLANQPPSVQNRPEGTKEN